MLLQLIKGLGAFLTVATVGVYLNFTATTVNIKGEVGNFPQIVKNIQRVTAAADKHIRVKGDYGNEDINAMAGRDDDGGYVIVVFRGIMEIAETPDQLALVLGHEYAHHMLGHTESFSNNEYEIMLPQLPETEFTPGGQYSTSIQHELMADLVGASIAKAAGYNPCEGVKFWAKMRDQFGDEPNDTHPTPTARMEQLTRVFQCVKTNETD